MTILSQVKKIQFRQEIHALNSNKLAETTNIQSSQKCESDRSKRIILQLQKNKRALVGRDGLLATVLNVVIAAQRLCMNNGTWYIICRKHRAGSGHWFIIQCYFDIIYIYI